MRILVTGKDGQLGRSIQDLVANTEQNDSFIFVGREELDLSSSDNIDRYFVANDKFDVIINCAAYTAVDKAEEEQDLADQINHLAVKQIAEIAAQTETKLVHISTDYVFDGENDEPYTELDQTNPVNTYGKTKLAGEIAIQKAMPTNAIIVRTSWLYSEYGNNFVKTMLRLGREKKEISVVSDQIGSPTYATDLAEAVLTIIYSASYQKQDASTEIYHYSNKGSVTWCEFAQEIISATGSCCKVTPISTSQYSALIAKRPKSTPLCSKKIAKEFDLDIYDWGDSLRSFKLRTKQMEDNVFNVQTLEGKSFLHSGKNSILDSALAAGLSFNHSCKNGQCGVCKIRLIKGEIIEIRKQSELTSTDLDNDYFLTCCCSASTDLLIDSVDLVAMRSIEVKTSPAKISDLQLLSEDVMRVELRLPPVSNFVFLRGQYVDIIGPNSIRRSYSLIRSPLNDDRFVVLIKKVKDGIFSDYWFNRAKTGDLLRIEGPKGTFFLRDRSKHLIFLATGVGIAPIISILDELDSESEFKQTKKISVFWGNRFQRDFVWRPDFKRLDVDFYPTISREDDTWTGERGYVQEVAKRTLECISQAHVYACGSDKMISSAKADFVKSGLSEKDFYSDVFTSNC